MLKFLRQHSVEIILISKVDKPLKVAVESDNIKVEYEEETGRTNISFLL